MKQDMKVRIRRDGVAFEALLFTSDGMTDGWMDGIFDGWLDGTVDGMDDTDGMSDIDGVSDRSEHASHCHSDTVSPPDRSWQHDVVSWRWIG